MKDSLSLAMLIFFIGSGIAEAFFNLSNYLPTWLNWIWGIMFIIVAIGSQWANHKAVQHARQAKLKSEYDRGYEDGLDAAATGD